MNKTKRVITLYRVSTPGQVEKDDIPMQKEACRRFIAENPDWQLERELYEKGVSGFKKSARERDAIVELQTMALQGEFDILLVYMFDRLGRRDDETPFIVEWFVRNGIEVWSTREGQRRFDSHIDKLLNYITFWQASGESIKTSIRTRTRMEQLTAEGHFTGGTVTYGYRLVHNARTNKRNREVYDLAIDEPAAQIIRLMFHKYVHEGFGAQRLSRYLAEPHITKPDGGDFPNTTINRILKNRAYLGIIHNGNVESDIIPSLQIIDPETFHEAQRLMKARATHHGDTPLNMAGHALMKGNIFCGHCRNRLTMATSGHKRTAKNGTVSRQTHFRYQCHHGVRHPNDCDGQSTYSVDKLDAIVEQVVLYQFSKIQTCDGRKAVSSAHRTHLDRAQALCARIRHERDSKQAELADYQAEVLQVIRGNSAFTQETLMPLIAQTQAQIERLEAELSRAEAELQECQQSVERELSELQTLQTWAELYKTCSFDERKMIVSRLIRRLYVYRGYRMEIEFNVSFEDFQALTVTATATTSASA